MPPTKEASGRPPPGGRSRGHPGLSLASWLAGLAPWKAFLVPMVAIFAVACGDDSPGPGNNNNNQSQPICGNGQQEQGEECDNGAENSDIAPDACRANCRLAHCGDGVIDQGEACDSELLGGATCASRGYTSGALGCDDSCAFDESGCTTCGNGTAEGTATTDPGYEACDGDDLREQTCPSQGRPLGLLGCNDDCTFDYALCTGALPVISAVEGTGTATPIGPRPEDQTVFDQTTNKQLATQRINSQSRELELRGSNIGGATTAQAVGQDSQGTIDFEVQTGGTNEMVRIRFPQALSVTRGGLFLLTLTTAYGPAQAQVFFLQGEAGVCTNTVNGDLTVTGKLTVNGAVDFPECPSGYTRDLSADPAIVVCDTPDGDEMVRAGDFWIDRYEMTVWDNPDCTMDVPGADPYGSTTGVDDYGLGFPDTGNWLGINSLLYACSKAGEIPSRLLTWFQAQQACAASGKRLCSNAEWQMAVAGTRDPGANDGLANTRCSTSTFGARPTGSAGIAPGDASTCVSRFGAEDMIGNLREWTADWYGHPGWNGVENQMTTEFGSDAYSAGGPAAATMTSRGTDESWRTNSPALEGDGDQVGEYFGPAAVVRGGHWNDGDQAGAFSLHLVSGPSDSMSYIGARCCRGR